MAEPLKLGLKASVRMVGGRGTFDSDRHNSAKLTEAEKAVKCLETENVSLRKELNDIRALYKQLITEGGHENFDERRVTLLKSQVIQLERQILLLTESLGRRSALFMEAENCIAAAVDFCSGILDDSRGCAEVRVPRKDLERILVTMETARARLFSSAEVTSSPDNLRRPLLMFSEFIKNRLNGDPVTLFDVCSGNIEHVNLKHVSRLEAKLVKLYKQLVLANSVLPMCVCSKDGAKLPELPTAVYGRLQNCVKQSCDMLEDVCSRLLELSLLVPSAPLPALDKPVLAEMTADNVLHSFTNGAKLRSAKRLVEALIKSVNYTTRLAGVERRLLIDELDFHRAVYEHQTTYIDSLFSGLTREYMVFQSDLRDLICDPLTSVTSSFEQLKQNSSEESLRNFIDAFRVNSAALSDVQRRLSADQAGRKNCDDILTEYESDFIRRIDTIRINSREQRDKLIAEMDLIKSQNEQNDNELKCILTKEKYSENNIQKHVSASSLNDLPTAVSERQGERTSSRVRQVCSEIVTGDCTCHVDGDRISDVRLHEKPALFRNRVASCDDVAGILATKKPAASRVASDSMPKKPVRGVAQQRLVLKPIKAVEKFPDAEFGQLIGDASGSKTDRLAHCSRNYAERACSVSDLVSVATQRDKIPTYSRAETSTRRAPSLQRRASHELPPS